MSTGFWWTRLSILKIPCFLDVWTLWRLTFRTLGTGRLSHHAAWEREVYSKRWQPEPHTGGCILIQITYFKLSNKSLSISNCPELIFEDKKWIMQLKCLSHQKKKKASVHAKIKILIPLFPQTFSKSGTFRNDRIPDNRFLANHHHHQH